jgi:hypothetical protein
MSHALPEDSGTITTLPFWTDVVERTFRSVLQTALPIASAVAASGAGVDAKAVAAALFAVVIFTVLKNVAGARVSTAGMAALIERAGSAAAATVLAFLPQAAMSSWSDWAAVDWGAVLMAAVASAAVATANYYLAPPVVEQAQVDLAA